MGVYEDMANDAGYSYGTPENQQMAYHIYCDEFVAYQQYEHQKWLENEIYPYLIWWENLGKINKNASTVRPLKGRHQ